MQSKWTVAQDAEVRQGWEHSWQPVRRDVREEIHVVRRIFPFPVMPETNHAGSAALTSDWLDAWRVSESAVESMQWANLLHERCNGSSHLPPSCRFTYYSRVWRLVSDDHRRSTDRAGNPQTVHSFVAESLADELHSLLDETFGELRRTVSHQSQPQEAIVGWMLQVLLTLRLHCVLLTRMWKHHFRSLEGSLIMGRQVIEDTVSTAVRDAFGENAFTANLVTAAVSLGTSPQLLAAHQPGSDVILRALLPIVTWCFNCGLTEVLTMLTEELKTRWSMAASSSSDMSHLSMAQRLLAVIAHSNALVKSLAIVMGEAQTEPIRSDIVAAILRKDTLETVVRGLFFAAIADVDAAALSRNDDQIACDQAVELEAGLALHLILDEGLGIKVLDDVLTAVIVEYIGSALGGLDATTVGHAASDALHLVDAVASARRVLRVPSDMPLLPASAKTSWARSRVAAAAVRSLAGCESSLSADRRFSEKHMELCLRTLSVGVQTAVTERSAHLEEAFALTLFGEGELATEVRDEMAMLCEYLLNVDRFVEFAKRCIAKRYIRSFSTEEEEHGSYDVAGCATAPRVCKNSGLTATNLLSLQHLSPGSLRYPLAIDPCGPITNHVEDAWRRFEKNMENTQQHGLPCPPGLPTVSSFAYQTATSICCSPSVAESTDCAGGIVTVLETHAALHRRLPSAVLSPLTSMLLELRAAYFVDSNTVASPLLQSHNDLSVFAAADCVVSGTGKPSLGAKEVLTLPPRPHFDVFWRCLSNALWRGHVPRGEQSHEQAILDLMHFKLCDRGVVAPLLHAVEWLTRQYSASYPRRILTWPVLAGEVILHMPLRGTGKFVVGGQAAPLRQQRRHPHRVLHCTPVLAILLMHFNRSASWSVSSLCKAMKPLEHSATKRALKYLEDAGLLEADVLPLNREDKTLRVRYPTLQRIDSGSYSRLPERLYLLDSVWMTTGPTDRTPSERLHPEGSRSELESAIAMSRNRAVEAAIVKTLKNSTKPLDDDALFDQLRASLQSHFVLERHLFNHSLNLLLEREYVRLVPMKRDSVPHVHYYEYVP